MPSHLTGRLWVPAPSLLVWRGLWKPISHRGGWRQSWESLTSWSRPTSALCQCRGPARALWDLPGQLAELRPSPRRLRDRRASWLQPSQGPGLEPPLDLSGLYQAMAPDSRQAVCAQESLCRRWPFPRILARGGCGFLPSAQAGNPCPCPFIRPVPLHPHT